jgi:hypothetical protein
MFGVRFEGKMAFKRALTLANSGPLVMYYTSILDSLGVLFLCSILISVIISAGKMSANIARMVKILNILFMMVVNYNI